MWRDPELRAWKQVKRKWPSCLFTVISGGWGGGVECQHCHPQSLGVPKSLIFNLPGNSGRFP